MHPRGKRVSNLAPTGAGLPSQGTTPTLDPYTGLGVDAGSGAGAPAGAAPTAGAASPAATGGFQLPHGPAGQSGAAGQLPGGLPGAQPTADASASGGAVQGAAPGQQAAAAMPAGLGGILKWAGPLGVIGGAAMAAYGFKSGSNMKTAMGAIGALGSLYMTMNTSKAEGQASGITQGLQAGYNQGQQETVVAAKQQMTEMTNQFSVILEQAKAEAKAEAAAGNSGAPLPGMPGPGGTGQSEQTATGGTGQTSPTGTVQTTPAGQVPGSDPAATTGSTSAPIANWTSQAVLGRSVKLPSAVFGADAVADAGSFVLKEQMGDPNGYATVDEADSVARAGVSDVWETKNARWIVLEHGGRFYAYSGHSDASGGMAAGSSPELPADGGKVATWHSLKALLSGWVAYHWKNGSGTGETWVPGQSAAAGQASTGTATGAGPATTVAPAASTTTPAATTTPTAGTPSNGMQPAVVAGGPTQVSSTVAQSMVGTGFVMTSQSGSANVQGQKVLGNTAGYATPGEAAQAIMADRAASPGGQHDRWLSIKGSDGQYYALRGSIVSSAVSSLPAGSSPIHVFGQSFGAWWNGSTWQAQAA